MTKKEKISKILGWAAFAFSASAFFLPLMNPDIFWHLSAGKYISGHLAPPRFDFLSWMLPGKEWVDFEWGSQLVYYLAYKAGGIRALFILKAALLCLVLLFFRGLALLYGRASLLPLALPVLAVVLAGGSDLRPENFSLLFFAAELYGLEKTRLEYLPLNWPFRLKVFVFFVLWINFDPGCLFGLALLGLYAAMAFLSSRGRGPEYLKLLLAGLAATLVNPYGWKIYGTITTHIFLAPGPAGYRDSSQWLCVLALTGALFGLVSIRSVRREEPPNPGRANLVRGGAVCWLLLSVWFYASFIWPQYTGSASFFRASSANLAQFLKANKKELSGLRLYNNEPWGGWLGWELSPDYKVFLDGRSLFGDRVLEAAEARASVGSWSALIEKYKFDLMLVTLNEPLVPIKQRLKNGKVELFLRPAYLFYLPKKDWAVIYWDYRVAAVVRRSALPAAWVAGREYHYLRPMDVPNLRLPVLAGEIPLSGLDRELRLYLDSHPGGEKASSNTALVNFRERIKTACAKNGARCQL